MLFVCLGNICRSPLAEGLYRKYIENHGDSDRVQVDSAGTGSWHIGQPADPRSIAEGSRRGAKMTMTARRVHKSDFDEFDLIVAMDRENLSDLHHWEGSRPEKIRLLRSFDPSADSKDVPDPYYDEEKGEEASGFQKVGDMIANALPELHREALRIESERRH